MSAKTAWQTVPVVMVGTVESTSLEANPLIRFAAFATALWGDRQLQHRYVQRVWIRAHELFKGSRVGEVYMIRQPVSPCDSRYEPG